MPSEARINAARINGAKSRGPKTPEGKSTSSKNSLRHGLLAKTIVLEGESSEAFIELLTSFQDEHQPETPTEEALIEEMAAARWRRERIRNMETGGLNHQIRHPKFMDDDDIAVQHFTAFRTLTDETRALDLLNRYDARYERQFRSALTSFLNLRAKRIAADPASDQDARPSIITYRWSDGPPTPPASAPETPAPPPVLGSFGNPTSSDLADARGSETPTCSGGKRVAAIHEVTSLLYGEPLHGQSHHRTKSKAARRARLRTNRAGRLSHHQHCTCISTGHSIGRDGRENAFQHVHSCRFLLRSGRNGRQNRG
jgi:hypothetical protein